LRQGSTIIKKGGKNLNVLEKRGTAKNIPMAASKSGEMREISKKHRAKLMPPI